MSDNEKFEQWAIVELFGHARIAGLVSEHTIGGCQFVRVDVPAVAGAPAFTKLYGQGAIYAISFVDQAVASAAAEKMRTRPVSVYDLADVRSDAVQRRLEQSNGEQISGFDEW